MVFMCQRDSFLKEFKTAVSSCDLIEDVKEIAGAGIELPKAVDGDPAGTAKVFRVVLEDTIIFPEGGGQPDDRGTINELEVVRSVRKGDKALHYVFAQSQDSSNNQEVVGEPFKTGDAVTSKIDWNRRFDHMQQHSGQHLITAIADSLYGFPTTSWYLGSDESYIELGTPDVSSEQMKVIENVANAKIREGIAVSVDVVELDDPKLKIARGRNLPEDVKGQIRIVTMGDIESNVCCGTHVTNLSQIQVIKLLHVTKKKGKGTCSLHFLCGDRVINSFTQQFQREQQLMGLLKASPADLPSAAEKLNVALKTVRKSCQVLSKDLAALEAKKLIGDGGTIPKLLAYHRDNADLDFANALLREIGPVKNYCLLITVKTEGSSGHMMLVGNLEKDKLVSIGESLCEVLEGKGNVRGNLYQAKVNKINNVKKAVKLAEDLIESL